MDNRMIESPAMLDIDDPAAAFKTFPNSKICKLVFSFD